MPVWDNNRDNSGTDMLEELLRYLNTANPDCVPPGLTSLTQPADSIAEFKAVGPNFSTRLRQFVDEESRSNLEFQDAPDESRGLLGYSFVNPALPKPVPSSSKFHLGRLFLSHAGYLDWTSLKKNNFQLLTKSDKLYFDMKELDKVYERHVMKIAIVYVGPGQDEQRAILENESGSDAYEAFVDSLGWSIDVATHPGYIGGLEANQSTGTRAPYYCTSTLEMIFHVATRMPTDPEDPQQVKKKRHIGNDYVHVIWNDNRREYRQQTIGGEFGDVQIVVTPLLNGLFSVQVFRNDRVCYLECNSSVGLLYRLFFRYPHSDRLRARWWYQDACSAR